MCIRDRSRNRNARTDEYGPQSVENRTRFLSDIIRGIKEVNGQDFPVQILINAIEENDENIGQNTQLTTVEENMQIAKMLADHGVDALHLRCGPFGKHVAEMCIRDRVRFKGMLCFWDKMSTTSNPAL